MASLKLRITACVAGSLLLGVLACDAEPPEPEFDLREGTNATFKTQTHDQSFSWKGCEPPWGDDPWMKEPTEEWVHNVGKGMREDLPAHVLGTWLDNGGAAECEEGCASLELAWSGEASMGEAATKLGKVRAIGRCKEKDLAWSVDVAVNTDISCACR